MIRRLVCLALVLGGCAQAAGVRDDRSLPAYADGTEYHVPTNRGVLSRPEAAVSGMTHYFQVNSRRLCFAYELPGTWQPAREAGSLRRVDGRGLVGAMLLSQHELGAGSPEQAIRAAAERSGELYAKERGSTPWRLERYSRMPAAWHWSVPVEGSTPGRPDSVVSIVPRWYLPAADGWIAQFSVGVPPGLDPDSFVTALVTSLTTSREPRCYEARLRELGGVR